tara:strand:+ start:267 stop:752 length:486 start_codon:yes stop_codon:yes gene_type:complete
MWNPGFTPKKIQNAWLKGWHRCFCVSSIIYRGTPKQPGLSLGLDVGGECHGLALCISEADREEVFDYLARREMPEGIYSCVPVLVHIDDSLVNAYTLIVNPDHKLYVGEMALEDMASRIAQGHGRNGSNRDYLMTTVQSLNSLGIEDEELTLLLNRVNQLI